MPAVREVSTAFVTGGSGFVGARLVRRLAGEGVRVKALARSDRAAATVAEAGAEPVPGDLLDISALRAGAEGCDTVFHAAAAVSQWGPWEEFERLNVGGTRAALDASRAAGVGCFVHVGTEAALMAGQPLVQVDETAPLRPDSPVPYPATKALAEQHVRAASSDGFETVVVRPRLVWGPGDTTILPVIVEMIERKRFTWVGGGHHLTSSAHVDNVAEGLLLGARHGKDGEAYFVTDGEPVEFRRFVTDYAATRGLVPPRSSVPATVARAAARASEATWRALRRPGDPPLTKLAVWNSALECTIDIGKARRELGYQPVVTYEEGMAAMTARSASAGDRP